jgi:maltose-binding protein MalE
VEPAQTYEALLEQAQDDVSVAAINTDFVNLFWGASAFGCQPCQSGELFGEEDEPLINGFDVTGWQAWLRAAAQTENFIFSDDQTKLEEMFLEGKVAYLVAGPDFLYEAQTALGIANVGLVKLPLGKGQRVSKPFLQVDGFYFYQKTTEEQTKLALKFAKFASLETNQTLLMQKANLVPASSLAIARTYDPAMLTFISGIEKSILLPRQSKLELLEEAVFDDFLRALDGDITVR